MYSNILSQSISTFHLSIPPASRLRLFHWLLAFGSLSRTQPLDPRSSSRNRFFEEAGKKFPHSPCRVLLFLKAKVGFDELAGCSRFCTKDFEDVMEGGFILSMLVVRRVRVEHQYIGNNDEAQIDRGKFFAGMTGKHFDRSAHAQYHCNSFST